MAEAKAVLSGLVLRETNTREADKILTVLTAQRGKLRLIARGARRKNSRVAAACQLLAWSELTVYQRGEWYYLDEGSSLELFSGLQKDLVRLSLGLYFAELTESLTHEELPAGPQLSLLLNALYALDKLQKSPLLVKAFFEWRAMALAGYEPLAGNCAVCGAEQPLGPVFDLCQGQVRCQGCGLVSHGTPLSKEALQGLRWAIYGQAKRLYSFPLERAALRELEQLAEGFVLEQLERGFTTRDFYHSLQKEIL